jgi:hypothetical protein
MRPTRGRTPHGRRITPIEFENVPIDQARLMGRGPRIEPMLYETLRKKIQDLSTAAVRIHLGPEIRPERMKNYLLRIARELDVPIPVRRVPGGVIFWRSSEEDTQQAQEIADRLQTGRQTGTIAPQRPSRKRTPPRR